MFSLLLLVACGGGDSANAPIPGTLPNGGEVIHTAHGVDVGQELLDAFLSGLTEEQAEQANQASNRLRLASELAKTRAAALKARLIGWSWTSSDTVQLTFRCCSKACDTVVDRLIRPRG